MAAIPRVLIDTMRKELVYEALRESSYIVARLPAYVEGSYYIQDAYVEEVEGIPPELQADIIWCVLEAAHNQWRSQLSVLELMLSETCSECLNAFAPLEMAGPHVYGVWAGHFWNLFRGAGFAFDWKHDRPDLDEQMLQMEALNFSQPMMLKSIFVVNRRRFVQGRRIAGYRDLLMYVSEIQNDVFGVIYGAGKQESPLAGQMVNRIISALYRDDNSESLQFRIAREIARANGDSVPPLSW